MYHAPKELMKFLYCHHTLIFLMKQLINMNNSVQRISGMEPTRRIKDQYSGTNRMAGILRMTTMIVNVLIGVSLRLMIKFLVILIDLLDL